MRSCWGRTTSSWKTQDSWAGLLLYHFLFFTLLLSLWEPSLLSMFVICCLFVCFLVCFHNKILETTRILVFPLLRVTTIDWDASCHFVLLLLSLLGTFSLLSEVFVVVFVFFPIRFAFYNFLTFLLQHKWGSRRRSWLSTQLRLSSLKTSLVFRSWVYFC